jgi:hypothetical protein
VKAVAVVSPKKRFCPGARAEVVFEVTLQDGSKKTTWTRESEKAGYLDYADFSFSSPHGKFDKNGDLTVETDPLVTMDSGVTVKVALAKRPELAVEQTFPPGYECVDAPVVYGQHGAYGAQGASGEIRQLSGSSMQRSPRATRSVWFRARTTSATRRS